MEKKINKKKQNKNSIIRLIISNYDCKGIKEFKVLYRKQGGVDTFSIKSFINNENKLEIDKDIKYWQKDKEYDCNYILNGNSIEIKKINKITNEETRKYIVSFKVSNKSNRVIEGEIKDILETDIKETNKFLRSNSRTKNSKTERTLLSESVCKKYAQIADCSYEEIDSLKIYKIRKFLNYRSNMLLYFSLINNFLYIPFKKKDCFKNDFSQLEKELEQEENWQKLINYVYENISEEIKNKKNNRDNNINKITNKINLLEEEQKRNINSKSKKIQTEIKFLVRSKEKLLKEEIHVLDKTKFSDDLKKIVKIFIEFRHSLMHYNYLYFENLFENKENDSLKKYLNLNIFKDFPILNKMEMESKTNHLTNDDKIFILGKPKKAKKTYSYYHGLCQIKNGFGKFINRFFYDDGKENKQVKALIEELFKKEIETLKEYGTKDESKIQLNEYLEQERIINGPYITDIQQSKYYKNLYNQHKAEVDDYMLNLNKHSEPNLLRKNHEEINKLKKQMDIITKRNFLIQLKYKMQIVFGFLYEEFDGNIYKFKNYFDSTNEQEINNYFNKAQNYLEYSLKENKKNLNYGTLEKTLEKLISKEKLNLESENSNNNLFKFYILIYLFLPREFKGDFLGFIKNHYYDIKNIMSPDEIEKNNFFHDIRLFEKNIKNYEIIKYSVSAKEYMKYLNLDLDFYEYRGTQKIEIFNKNIILPIFKYYEIIFKLCNDIEICGLFKTMEKTGWSLKKAIKEAKNGKYLNFNKLIKNLIQVLGSDEDSGNLTTLRNSIAHFDLKELLEGILEPNLKENKYISNNEVSSLLKFARKYDLDKINLGINFINDFFMKKENFIVGQGIQIKKEDTPKEDEIFYEQKYKIDPQNIKSYYKTAQDLPNDKDSRILMGIYKKKGIRLLKEKLIEKIIFNEDKMVNIHVSDYINKEDKIIDIFLKRKGNTNKFEKDIENYIDEEKKIINSSNVDIDNIQYEYLFKYTFKRNFIKK